MAYACRAYHVVNVAKVGRLKFHRAANLDDMAGACHLVWSFLHPRFSARMTPVVQILHLASILI